MDVLSYNRRAWDKRVSESNRWTLPVSPEVIAAARNGVNEIRRALREAGIGTVVLRGSVEPEKYWEMRKQFENPQLPGKAHLFITNGEAMVCVEGE